MKRAKGDGMAMDNWGQCIECERWFYCGNATLPTCPVCGSPPARIEQRGTDTLDTAGRA